MKKYFYAIALFTSVMQAQVGIGTSTPNGALDVNSALPLPSPHKAGLMPPNVALRATDAFATTTAGSNIINPNGGGNPLTGTLVYNTATSAPGPNQVTPGYYYYDGSLWVRLNTVAPGTILNTVMTNITGTPVTVSTTTFTTIATVNYTPISVNSTIIVEFNTKYDIGGFNADSFSSQIVMGPTLALSNQITYNTQKFVNNSGGGTRSSALFPLMGAYTNTTTAAKIITIQARRDSADDNIVFQRDNSTWIKITEIAR